MKDPRAKTFIKPHKRKHHVRVLHDIQFLALKVLLARCHYRSCSHMLIHKQNGIFITEVNKPNVILIRIKKCEK
jgi:hypothetical protein